MLAVVASRAVRLSAASIWNASHRDIPRYTITAGEPRPGNPPSFILTPRGDMRPAQLCPFLLFAGAAMSRISIFH